MRTFLIVAGAVWITLAMLMVLAVACAARRRLPPPPRKSRRTMNPLETPLIVNSGNKTPSEQLEMQTLVEK